MPATETTQSLRGFDFKLHINETEKIDKRSSRYYARRVTLTLSTTDPDVAPAFDHPRYAVRDAAGDAPLDTQRALKLALEAAVGGLPREAGLPSPLRVKNVHASFRRNAPAGDDNPWTLYLKLDLKASRPSAIKDPDATAFEIGRLLPNLLKTLVTTVEAVKANRAAAEEAAHDAEQAGRLLGWLRSEADKKARKVVRFKQRLAALEAELAAEQEAQAEDLLATFDDADELEGFSARAIATAKALAADPARTRTSPRRGFMRASTPSGGVTHADLVTPTKES